MGVGGLCVLAFESHRSILQTSRRMRRRLSCKELCCGKFRLGLHLRGHPSALMAELYRVLQVGLRLCVDSEIAP